MADSKGFYAALGISEGSSISQVKAAYKKKQMELHPSGPIRKKLRESAEYKAMTDEQKAKKEKELDDRVAKVNEAINVLSDEKRKQDYDSGSGEFSAFGNMGFNGGFRGFDDLFKTGGFGGSRQKRQYKVPDLITEIKVECKDLFLGKTNKYRVKLSKTCNGCNGKGAKETNKCGKCNGNGVLHREVSLGGIFATVQEVQCEDCMGKGYVISGPKCSECKGQKLLQDSKIVEVEITPGMYDGQEIVFAKQGNESPGLVNGDLVFVLKVTDKHKYQRIEDDLVYTMYVDLLTVISGGTIYFDHPNSKKMAIKCPPFKSVDAAIIVNNEGFKNRKTGKTGRLVIKPNILINSGLDRDTVSKVIKPMISKPSGDFSDFGSVLGPLPTEREEHEEEGRSGFFGGGAQDFFSFFQ